MAAPDPYVLVKMPHLGGSRHESWRVYPLDGSPIFDGGYETARSACALCNHNENAAGLFAAGWSLDAVRERLVAA